MLEELGQVELRLHGLIASLGLTLESVKNRVDKLGRDLLLARGLGELEPGQNQVMSVAEAPHEKIQS